MITNEEIYELMKTKQYNKIWEQCQYIGYHWIKSTEIRHFIFSDFIDFYGGENFIDDYTNYLIAYKSNSSKPNVATTQQTTYKLKIKKEG